MNPQIMNLLQTLLGLGKIKEISTKVYKQLLNFI